MQKSKGFTLVELVIVIVILGILAVTAAPKFLNLSSDAKISTVNGVKGALQSANAILYSKAVLAGQQKESSGSVTVEGTSISLVYGYVKADDDEVKKVLEIEGGFTVAQQASDLTYENGTDDVAVTTADVIIYTGTTAPTAASACLLVYKAAASATTKPTYQSVTSGC